MDPWHILDGVIGERSEPDQRTRRREAPPSETHSATEATRSPAEGATAGVWGAAPIGVRGSAPFGVQTG